MFCYNYLVLILSQSKRKTYFNEKFLFSNCYYVKRADIRAIYYVAVLLL